MSLAAAHGVSLLTGGPGTGKSRTVAAIVALCRKVDATIALAAPTGRAAKRLEELAGNNATTVHRLLGARPPRAGRHRVGLRPRRSSTRSRPTWSSSTRPRCSTSNSAPR